MDNEKIAEIRAQLEEVITECHITTAGSTTWDLLETSVPELLDALESATSSADKWKARVDEAYKDGLRTGHENNEYREELWDAERDSLQDELDREREERAKTAEYVKCLEGEALSNNPTWRERAQAAESRYYALHKAVGALPWCDSFCACKLCTTSPYGPDCNKMSVTIGNKGCDNFVFDEKAWRERNNG